MPRRLRERRTQRPRKQAEEPDHQGLRRHNPEGGIMEQVAGIAPQAQKDFARGAAPEFAGIRASSFIAARDVSDRPIERHGAKVARIYYYQLLTHNSPRRVLVYLTAEGLVTDEDVLGE
jgi:hypothetical protein